MLETKEPIIVRRKKKTFVVQVGKAEPVKPGEISAEPKRPGGKTKGERKEKG